MSRYFRHFKKRHDTGREGIYELLDVVLSADTQERMVVYGSIEEPGLHWVRKESEFLGTVRVEEEHLGGGVSVLEIPRFAPLGTMEHPDHTVVWHI
jgi:hypothetical protein